MKKIIFIFLVSCTTITQAQKFKKLDASPMDRVFYPMSNKVSDKAIIITYSRPQLKGRELEELIPAYKVWRTGANEATEIRILKPVKFGDTTIKTGTYTLYSYPKEESTEIIINSAKYVWGAYNYDKTKDIARLEVPVFDSSEYLEAFSLSFAGKGADATLHGGWGNIRVSIPITVL